MTTAALPLPNGEECQAPQPLTAIRNEKKFHECYELSKEILGNGSFSTVYSAKSMSPRRRQWSFSDRYDLAIKCIAKEKLDHDDILSIFNEVALLQTLHHPNIIRLENFFEENHFFYIVMERLVGGDLFDRLISKECYYEFEAKKVAKNLLDAVAFMHKRGVVHRDLKPENLLLVTKKDDYNVKIADFGFAKYCDDSCNDGLGNLRTQVGTPTYISPEILNATPYGTKSDMWSVGVIFYILLAGYAPFVDNDQNELFRKITNAEYEFHKDSFHQISNDAKNLISSLLQIDPKKRISALDALKHKWVQCDDKTLLKHDLIASGDNKNNNRKKTSKSKSMKMKSRFSLLCGDLCGDVSIKRNATA